MAWLLALLTLLPSSSLRAQPLRGPRCPDGKPPVFTGLPFSPLSCAKEPPATEVQLSSVSLPSTNKAPLTLDDLVGRWEGIVSQGIGRYRVSLTVAGAKKGYAIRFENVELTGLVKHVFDAELKGRAFFGSKGPYDAVVTLQELPEPHDATVFIGAPYAPDKDGLDRELVLVYRGRSDAHRLRFKLDKDALRFRYDYSYAQPTPGTISSSGELRRGGKTP